MSNTGPPCEGTGPALRTWATAALPATSAASSRRVILGFESSICFSSKRPIGTFVSKRPQVGYLPTLFLLLCQHFTECCFFQSNFGLVALRVDERIRPALAQLGVLRFDVVHGRVRSQRHIALEAMHHLEPPLVFVQGVRVGAIVYQLGPGVHTHAANDHDVIGLACVLNLQRPRGAPMRVAGSEMRD